MAGKKKEIYIILMSFFVLYLVKANKMVVYYFDNSESRLEKVNLADISCNSTVYSNIDISDNLGGLLENVYFEGWAYCETEHDNSDKNINLIFKSLESDLAYISRCKAQDRHDVYGAFKDKKQIYNAMNGVECVFSPIAIKNGTYRLYVNVIENDINYGLSETDLIYIKDSSGFHGSEI